MGRVASRRAVLIGALSLSACGDYGAYHHMPKLAIHAPTATQERLFEAIRAFAREEGYDFSEGRLSDDGRHMMLSGWRSMIMLNNKYEYLGDASEPLMHPEDFEVNFLSTMYGMPWGLHGDGLEALVSRFSEAAAVDGVTIERVAQPAPEVISIERLQ